MSKITNHYFTRSGIGCFIAVLIWQQWGVKGLKQAKQVNNVEPGDRWRQRAGLPVEVARRRDPAPRACGARRTTRTLVSVLGWVSRDSISGRCRVAAVGGADGGCGFGRRLSRRVARRSAIALACTDEPASSSTSSFIVYLPTQLTRSSAVSETTKRNNWLARCKL